MALNELDLARGERRSRGCVRYYLQCHPDRLSRGFNRRGPQVGGSRHNGNHDGRRRGDDRVGLWNRPYPNERAVVILLLQDRHSRIRFRNRDDDSGSCEGIQGSLCDELHPLSGDGNETHHRSWGSRLVNSAGIRQPHYNEHRLPGVWFQCGVRDVPVQSAHQYLSRRGECRGDGGHSYMVVGAKVRCRFHRASQCHSVRLGSLGVWDYRI